MTRLFIEDKELDITDDFSHQITYAIDDLNHLDSKSTSFTKTIVLPATTNNNKLLGNIFEFGNSNFTDDTQPNVLYNFNASKSAKARIEVNGLMVMKGVIRLLEIFIDGNNIEYEVALFGELGGFIAKVGGKKLTENDNQSDDLDFSAYNHTYSVANIIASWNDSINFSQTTSFASTNYCVLNNINLISYFTIGQQVTISNTTNNNGIFNVSRVEILARGFILSLKISFLESTNSELVVFANFSFPKYGLSYVYPLIDYGNVSYNIPQSTTPVYIAKKDYQYTAFRPAFFVREIMSKIITGAGYTWNSDFFNSNFFRRLIVPNNYKGLLRKDISNYVEATSNTDQTLYPNSINQIEKNVLFNAPTLATNINYNSTTGVFQYTGANPINVKVSISLNYNFIASAGSGSIFFRATNGLICRVTTYIGTHNLVANGLLSINTGDTFALVYGTSFNPYSGSATLTIISGASLLIENNPATNIPYQLGDTINMNDLLPKNILQKDFFTSIMKMFNLMIVEDKLIEKRLNIIPNVDFYDLNFNSYLDWSDKVNRAEVIKIKPMSEINARYYTFKYKDDSDFYNDKYKKQYNETYGSRTFDNALDFAKDTSVNEVIFAPTPLVGYPNCDKVVSTILKLNNGLEENIESVVRIMQIKLIEDVQSWKILNTNTLTNTTTILDTRTNYLYAGHFDNPDVPNADLNFGATKELYFTLVSGALSNNVFNSFYSSYMAEITDKDSRLLTCKMLLHEKDIFNLDFGRFIWIDGILYRLIKIVDYCENNLCEVQLLRVIYSTYELIPPASEPPPLFSIKINVPIATYASIGTIYTGGLSPNFDAIVDYGDGTIYNHSGNVLVLLNNYAVAGTYTITIDITNPIGIEIYYNDPISDCSIDNLYNLDALNFQSFSFQNQQTRFNNPIDFSTFKGLGFEIQYNTYGNNNIIFPTTSNTISILNFNYGHFSSSQINSVLATLINYNTIGQLDMQYQSGSTAPTGQGIIDKATLISRGWIINTD